MKIIELHFESQDKNTNLDAILTVIGETLAKMSEVEIERVNVRGFNEEISNEIKFSDGIIIAVSSVFALPNSVCVAFFENLIEGNDAFSSKDCLIISSGRGEKEALDRLAHILNVFGAVDTVRIAGDTQKELIEIQTENFYRIIKRNKKESLYKTPSHDNLHKRTAAELLAERSGNNGKLSVKQLTMKITDCYRPQFADGLKAVIQISVMGAEAFDCFLKTDGEQCSIFEGLTDERDMIVTVDSKVWEDVLKGKHTAQKAFMTGRLKVKGNFMLLEKFDRLFGAN